MKRLVQGALGAAFVVALLAVAPSSAFAAGPIVERGGGEDYFFDDFLLEMCGIETYTTLTERWTLKIFPDGSEQLHVVRTFVSDDPRIPIEKGAGTSFTAPDGTRVIAGKPIHLLGPDGGVTLLGAGRTIFGEDGVVVHGRDVLDLDWADYYCAGVTA